MISTRAAVTIIGAVASRPNLWITAVRQAAVLAPAGWHRKFPPLPLPDSAYLGFRFETAYGSASANPPASDVVAYLEWCKRNRP